MTAAVEAVAAAGRQVRRVRAAALEKVKGGLRAVYRTLQLPGKSPLKDAHAALDAATPAAYGFSPKKDLLARLLELNLAVARKIDAGQRMTPPGVPDMFPDVAKLLTIRATRPTSLFAVRRCATVNAAAPAWPIMFGLMALRKRF